jgi:hypothetical protein
LRSAGNNWNHSEIFFSQSKLLICVD